MIGSESYSSKKIPWAEVPVWVRIPPALQIYKNREMYYKWKYTEKMVTWVRFPSFLQLFLKKYYLLFVYIKLILYICIRN